MALVPRDVEALLRAFRDGGWHEMRLRVGDDELFVSNDPDAAPEETPATIPAGLRAGDTTSGPSPDERGAEARAVAPAGASREGWVALTAPNLGTFYRAPDPQSPPYVEVGDAVEPQTEVCLIEVMKLFTTIPAGASGTVREICVAEGAMVEHGQTLMWIEPG